MTPRLLALLFVLLPALAAAEEPPPVTLEALKAAARVNDPRVKAAMADVSKVRGLQSEADAARFPSITAFAVGGAPVPEAVNDPNHIDNVTPVSRLGNWQLGNWGFLLHFDATLVQPLYTFGKIDNYRAAARSGVEAMQSLVDAAQQQADRDATEAFWGYQLARELMEGLDTADKQIADARKTAANLLEEKSPQVTRSDMFKIDMLRAELKGRRAQAVAGLDLAREAVRVLLALPPEAKVNIAVADLRERPMEKLQPFERYLEAAAAHRPEILAAARAVKARELLVAEKRSEYYPDVLLAGTVNANWSNAATRQTNPFAYDPYNGKTAGLGLALRWKFELAQDHAKLEQAEADLERARADSLIADAGVRLQVYQAYSKLKSTLDRLSNLEDERDAARRWLTSATLGFDAGAGEAQDVIVAALAVTYVEAALLAEQRDAWVLVGDLSRAIGVEATSVR